MTWFQQFGSRYSYPVNYTTMDLETDGLNPERDTICTFGFTRVRDRKPVETLEWVLNWPDSGLIDSELFREKLIRTQHVMEKQNKHFHHTYEYLQQHGEPPLDVLRKALEVVEGCERTGELVVAQNGYRFDAELLQAHFHNWLNIQFLFGDNALYDTGIAEKASQLGPNDEPLPTPGESMRAWAFRIGNIMRRGVKWALDGHCEERYGLCEKRGLDSSQHHRSGFDSLLIHHLFEEHRQLAGAAANA